ncbi:TPA: Arc family DNA-binding protein [Stenotrophomonas maltophilia]|nr:Arc family DNA-binding protein [Stenotrophomonas maltophilia]
MTNINPKKPGQADYVKTALRVPPALHQQIHQAAERNHRTFNGEILARLERTFSEEPTL